MARLLVAALLLVSPFCAEALVLTGETRWQGRREFSESVRVEAGAVLTVAPGSEVIFRSGGLEVAGRLVARQAVFHGSDWDGIVLKGCDEQTRLEQVVIRGARTGLFVGGGAPQLREVTFERNRIGAEIKQKSTARLERCRFAANEQAGLLVKDDSAPQLSGNSFSGNGRFGAYLHRSTPAPFRGNRFEGEQTALMISHFGTTPRIEENLFSGNQVAVMVDRAALPVLSGNRLLDNATGIHLHRRSDALISGNLLARNQVAVLVSYSSYPQLRGNDFRDNPVALKLEFQSAQWEEEQGENARSSETTRQGSFGGGSAGRQPVSVASLAAETRDGTVDARGNWWGAAGTAELARIGQAGNPGFIEDGRDRATFSEGGRLYPLDRAIFSPWETGPVTALSPDQP